MSPASATVQSSGGTPSSSAAFTDRAEGVPLFGTEITFPSTFIWNVFGKETGVSLGGEAMLVRGTQTDSGVRSTASAISVGPFVGGKWTTDIGFTLDSQLGVQYSTLSSTSTSSEGTASSAGEGVGGLFNLNLGWSF